MPLAEFYTVKSRSSEVIDSVTRLSAAISINSLHPIFEGHFPGQPIVPGVCMMQMVTETMIASLGFNVMLAEASNVKFLSVLNPLDHQDVNIEIHVSTKGSGYGSTSRIYLENLTFFKMEAVFQVSLFKLPGPISP